jgi:AraC-like DNA-binding protein
MRLGLRMPAVHRTRLHDALIAQFAFEGHGESPEKTSFQDAIAQLTFCAKVTLIHPPDEDAVAMGSTIPSTHFSTSDLPTIDQFDAWRDKISVIFDVDRIGGPRSTSFEANVDAYQIGNLVITDSMQGEQAYSLSPKRIRTAGIDLFQVGFYRSGSYRGDANGRPIEGKAGDVQVLDLAQPMHSVEPASDMTCVFLPRKVLQNRIGDLDGLHGVDLRSGRGRVLVDYLGLLVAQLPQMAENDGEATANATIDMIAACLRPTATMIREAQSPIRQVTLLRAQRVIEGNLRSPQLTPAFLCRTLGVSRRSLYRLFEPLDGVHQYILRRRLSHIRQALNDQHNHQRLADLAARYGFTCRETFWRAFRRQYGATPGEVRLLNSSHQKNEPPCTDAGFDEWLKRLHA